MESETRPTTERIRQYGQLLKEWIAKQPHLPDVEDEEWLITVLHHNEYNLEKTKTKLDNYFSFRTKYPEILKNRDPMDPETVRAMAACRMVFAKKLTKNGEQLTYFGLQPDTSIFKIKNVFKLWFMLYDTIYLEHERHEHNIFIVDHRYFRYAHFMKAVAWLKRMVDIFFTGYSDKIKAIHVINAPPELNLAIRTFKRLLPKKITERFFIHSMTVDLCKMVDEDVLCSDLGGKGPSYEECEEYTWKRLQKHRKWFLEQSDVSADEDVREKTDSGMEQLAEFCGKLEID